MFLQLRLSQNFSFGKATLDLWEKAGLGPLFQEVLPKTKAPQPDGHGAAKGPGGGVGLCPLCVAARR
jgi:hypothetical protein